MALTRHRHHRRRRYQYALSFAIITALTLLLLSSVSAVSLNPSTPQLASEERREEVKMEILKRVLTQRRLNGPGSSPPTCRSKCGRCNPCNPVHVPIQPALTMPLEYYPEAWRCKCGNKLFMP